MQLADHNIAVTKELAPVPRITGDPVKLEQVFMNLLRNAQDAVETFRKQDMWIRIKTCHDKDAGRVVIYVEDNGGGIPAGVRRKMFDPFFTTKEPGKGTGLGLSISKRIVEEFGGTIELETREGEGSVFSVSLPAGADDPEMAGEKEPG